MTGVEVPFENIGEIIATIAEIGLTFVAVASFLIVCTPNKTNSKVLQQLWKLEKIINFIGMNTRKAKNNPSPFSTMPAER